MKKPRKALTARLIQSLDLPAETDPNVPKMTMVGRSVLLVENHRGVSLFSETRIVLATSMGEVEITGEALSMSEFSAERAFVRGTLTSWRFGGGA